MIHIQARGGYLAGLTSVLQQLHGTPITTRAGAVGWPQPDLASRCRL